jgi:RES domain-containing protein
VIHAWRLFKGRYARTDLQGEGSRLYGGRFNSKGVSVVYVSSSLALAAMEMLVHLQSVNLLAKYRMRRVSFHERLVMAMDADRLPPKWRISPPSKEVQRVGDDWVASGKSAVLRVSSALLPQESNYILNPAHTDFSRIIFGPPEAFIFPPRVIEALRS